MKFLIDTNVYIETSKSELNWKKFEINLLPLLPFVYLSSVVAFELKLSGGHEEEVSIQKHIHALENVKRVITPTFDDWLSATQLIGGNSRRAYLCDVLIGYSARRLGAVLFTFDYKDFNSISKHIGFKIQKPW